ncbi:MAG TPA: tetratricopeptide repeat protein, partial [Polyangia bacterium]
PRPRRLATHLRRAASVRAFALSSEVAMNPVKCPNCRLSLPQNWAGMTDPNAKCPYCGKALASQVPGPGAPPTAPAASPVAPAAPAPSPSRPAKTMLWGAGVAIPGLPPKTGPAFASPPGPSPARPATDAFATSATQARQASAAPALAAPTPAQSTPEGADIDMDFNEPSEPVPGNPTVQNASKPNQPAATVMFESPNSATNMSLAKMDRLASEAEPVGAGTTAEVPEAEPEEDVVVSRPSRPTPTKSKFKSKPLPKKGNKSKTGKPKWSTAEEDADEPQPAASKTPIIVVVAVALLALIGAGVYLLRGKSGGESAAKEPAKAAEQAEPTPTEDPAALAAKPAPVEAVKPAPTQKPAAKDKPAHAEKLVPAEKPAHAEKPARAEKPVAAEKPKAEAATPEPKSTGAKPSEEDYRRANEAYQRGNAKLFQGNSGEAIAAYDQALRLNPKDPAIHRGLGLAYAQSGNSAEAIKHLKLYLKAAPKATDRAIIEKRIDQLHGH